MMNSTISTTPITVVRCRLIRNRSRRAFSRNGYPTYLWGYNPDHMQRLATARKNQAFYPDIPFRSLTN